MTLDEYIRRLEPHVDAKLVHDIEDWTNDTKLYMYLHNIQLAYMADFKQQLAELKNERNSS